MNLYFCAFKAYKSRTYKNAFGNREYLSVLI